jgi:hypothetical protein
MAAARFMPGVCGVLMSSSFEWTTRTPSNFHPGVGRFDRHVASCLAAQRLSRL